MKFRDWAETNQHIAMVLSISEYRKIVTRLEEFYAKETIDKINEYLEYKCGDWKFLLCNPALYRSLGIPTMNEFAVTFVDRVSYKNVEFEETEETKFILLLGKNELVEAYAKDIFHLEKAEIGHYPGSNVHYTEYEQEVERIDEVGHTVITSQNIEFIDYLLDSGLEFEVWTIYENGAVRKLTKEEAIEAHREMGLELR